MTVLRLSVLCLCLAGGMWAVAAPTLPPAMRVDGVTLFPLRYIAEWCGADVAFGPTEGRIRIRLHEHAIGLRLNQPEAYLDGRPVSLPVPPCLRDGITYVPVRFVAEALGVRVTELAGPDEASSRVVALRDPETTDTLLLRVLDPAEVRARAPLGADALAAFAMAAAGDVPALRALLNRDATLVSARDDAGATPLLAAAETGKLEAVTLLLERGAAINAADDDGRNALHRATAGGWTELTVLLIAHGAHFNRKDVLGMTPLHLAARYAQSACAARLLDYGAAPDAKDAYGQTPLLAAARGGATDVALLLLNTRVDVNARDIDWYTPLHRAAARGDATLVSLLLAHGAVRTMRAKGGSTPRQLALQHAHPEVAELLKE